MWHLTERETKEGMLANTLTIKGIHYVFSSISHRLIQNLLHLLFTVTHQGVLSLHLKALGYLWAECFVQMVRGDHMLSIFVFFDENQVTDLILRVMVSCFLLLKILGKHLKYRWANWQILLWRKIASKKSLKRFFAYRELFWQIFAQKLDLLKVSASTSLSFLQTAMQNWSFWVKSLGKQDSRPVWKFSTTTCMIPSSNFVLVRSGF